MKLLPPLLILLSALAMDELERICVAVVVLSGI
jgi:hypothetical protein